MKKYIRSIVIGCVWVAILVLCFIYRDKITVESIVNFTPENTLAASVIMLCLFALKSVTFFVYGGLLYAANGILFPLPYAIFINTLGTVVMTTIPFFIGKKLGEKSIRRLIDKYPKMSILLNLPNKNELFTSFFVRIVGCLPADPVGMFLGASGIRYSRYLCGTLLGLSSAIITFSVMGMSINDVSSPTFIISAIVEVSLIVLSVSIYLIWKMKNKKKFGGNNDT